MDNPTNTNNACKACSGPTSGFKCDACGVEVAEFDADHKCGGDHFMPKCVSCGEAESKCICGGKGGKGGK